MDSKPAPITSVTRPVHWLRRLWYRLGGNGARQRVAAQQAVAGSRSGDRYETLVERMAGGLVQTDLDDVIQYVNRRFCEMTGYSREELVGKVAYRLLLATADRKRFATEKNRQRAQGISGQYEMPLRTKLGETMWLQVSGSPYYDDEGKVVGTVSTHVDITERKRAESKLAKQERERALLDQARTALARELNLTRVIVSVVEGIAETFGYALVSLYLAEGDTLVLQHQVGYDHVISQLSVSRGVMGRVYRTSEPMLIENASADPEFIAAVDGIVSEICVPLHDQGRVVGVLNVESTQGRRLTAEDMSLMSALTEHVSVAIERARLYTEARERARRLELITRIARETAAIRDLDKLLHETVRLIRNTFGFYSTTILLVEGDAVVVRAASQPAAQARLGQLRVPISEASIVGWVAERGERLVVPDVRHDPRFLYYEEARETLSAVAVPIKWENETIGVLNVESDKANSFSKDDAFTMQTVADQLAVAIENAMLYRQQEDHRKYLTQAVEERTRELQAAYEDLQSLSKVKDEFVAHVSHEMRTPIANLKLYHFLLESGSKDPATYLETLNRETDRLHSIVEGVLQLSRMDQGEVSLKLAPVNLNRVAEQYVTDRSSLAAEKGLELSLEAKLDTPNVVADEGLLGQALSTLLTNALNYTPEGGEVTVRTVARKAKPDDVTAQGRPVRGWAGFSIEDNGRGISPEDQPHLFERFYRGRVARESGVPGTGLGLSIAHDISERMGGYVEFFSEGVPGKGTTFTVWLPVEA